LQKVSARVQTIAWCLVVGVPEREVSHLAHDAYIAAEELRPHVAVSEDVAGKCVMTAKSRRIPQP